MFNRLGISLIAITLVGIIGIVINFTKNSPSFSSSAEAQSTDIPWPMAGANLERTSWTPENLPDNIATTWVKPIVPYVPQRVQVVGAEGKVFVSTSMGLYAFNADTGADVWQYSTGAPLGHSPTYSNGYLYVGGLDKKIHKVRASDGQPTWTFTADGGFSSNPIVANGKVYATNRDGALYAINDSTTPTLAWKFQTGNQILQSPAYKDNVLYFASTDGYAYAVNANTGTQVWQSDSNPTTSEKDKFISNGFYTWWPVIYGEDVIFSGSVFYSTNGVEAGWLFCPTPSACSSTQQHLPAGTVSTVTQSDGYWQSGEKIMDVRVNPNGTGTIPDYFENMQPGETGPQHGQFRSQVFFVNRTTGLERKFDLDNDGKTEAAPILWSGDSPGHRDPPIVSGRDNRLYFHTVNRSRSLSFNNANISAWRVGTPYLSLPASYVKSSDEPTGISAAGDKIFYNHCCDRAVGAINIAIPNATWPSTSTTREWSYIGSGGLNFYSWSEASGTIGLPNNPSNYYFKEAVKYFWDPKTLTTEPTLPCCAAVFWNENEKVGPSAYNGKLYVILGNALVAIGQGGAGKDAPILPSAPAVTPPPHSSTITDVQLKQKLEQEIQEIIAAGHLLPANGANKTHHMRGFEANFGHYWHNPADLHRVLLKALPHLSISLQDQLKIYLQSEFTLFPPTTCSHIGFTGERCNLQGTVVSTRRDPFPYPPAETQFRLFNIPTIRPNGGDVFAGWNFPPHNVYSVWKYAQAGLGNPATLLSQWGSNLRTPITANKVTLTDAYLEAFPNVHNAYIAGYIGYIELAKMAGQTPSQYQAHQDELNRLLQLRVTNLKTFPDTQQNFGTCDNECYFESHITHYNFAYMTPELGDYLRENTQTLSTDKNILTVLQKYQSIAPYWMMAHNGETQGEFAVMNYQQTHSLFQGLALVKNASRDELIKHLDTPIVPVGDLYYIDNLVAVLEANALSGTAKPGDANNDNNVDEADYGIWFSHYAQVVTNTYWDGDFNADGTVDGLDYVIWLTNYGT